MFKKLAIPLSMILGCGLLAAAQEVRSEVTFSGTGIFTKDANNNGLLHKATDTGGVLAGYRYNISRWAAVEANYGWNRNSQEYFTLRPGFGAVGDRIQANIHQVTADFVYRIPTVKHLRPYVLGGGGALIFNPVERNVAFTSGGIFSPGVVRVPTRAQGTFVYGGGADIDLTTREGRKPGVSVRLGYRGYVYQVPDFGFSRLDLDSWTHTAQPEAGLTFRF